MSDNGKMSDLFFEVASFEAAREALHRLCEAWPDDQLTGLHYIVARNDAYRLIGASFAVAVTHDTLRRVVGPEPKLTELSMQEIMDRIKAREFHLAMLGDAGRMLGVER